MLDGGFLRLTTREKRALEIDAAYQVPPICIVACVGVYNCPSADWTPRSVPRGWQPQDKWERGSGYENFHNQINIKEQREILLPSVLPPLCLVMEVIGVKEFWGSIEF